MDSIAEASRSNRPPGRAVSPRARVIVCDDDVLFHEAVALSLGQYYELFRADTGAELLALLPSLPGCLVVLDLRLAGRETGFDVLARLRALDADARVIVHSGMESYACIVRAMQLGALDYLPKTSGMMALRRVLTKWTATAVSPPSRPAAVFAENSPAARRCMVWVRELAAGDGRVLVVGEAGAGKSLIAENLRVSGEPFVRLAAAGVATDRRLAGGLEQDGGVVVIEEVADLCLHTQARLLAVVEADDQRRFAGGQAARATARLVCTTRYDLHARCRQGKFLPELLMRVATCVVDVPPLRDRRGDVEPLARHFAARMRGGGAVALSPPLIAFLEQQTWPGNVRQLANVMQYLLAMAGDADPDVGHLLPLVAAAPARAPAGGSPSLRPAQVAARLRDRLRAHETALLREEFRLSGYSVTKMSHRVGMNRTYLYDKLRSAGLLGSRKPQA